MRCSPRARSAIVGAGSTSPFNAYTYASSQATTCRLMSASFWPGRSEVKGRVRHGRSTQLRAKVGFSGDVHQPQRATQAVVQHLLQALHLKLQTGQGRPSTRTEPESLSPKPPKRRASCIMVASMNESNTRQNELLPGIEPGLRERSDCVRIPCDNRYTIEAHIGGHR
jgi:hypothetical protein